MYAYILDASVVIHSVRACVRVCVCVCVYVCDWSNTGTTLSNDHAFTFYYENMFKLTH